MKIRDILDYFRFSEIVFIFCLNPFNWRFVPRYFKNTEWRKDRDYTISFLFLTIRVSIDDGSW